MLSRNVATTRVRDFYDIYELWRGKKGLVGIALLAEALEATYKKRNNLVFIECYPELVGLMREDAGLARQWDAYGSKHSYARGISFAETLDAVQEIMQAVTEAQPA